MSGQWWGSDGGGFDDGGGGVEGGPEGGPEPVFQRFSYGVVLVFGIVLFLYRFST